MKVMKMALLLKVLVMKGYENDSADEGKHDSADEGDEK